MLASNSISEVNREIFARVTAAIEVNDIRLATDLASQAVADGIVHPLFLNLRAYRLENEGFDAEALSDLRKAAALAPHDPFILNALGLACARCGHYEDAVVAFEKAASEKPDFSQAVLNLGWSLEEIGELAAAKKYYLRAHEAQPNWAEPVGRLASLAARLGQWCDVREYAERALSLDPNNSFAVLALGKAEIEQGAFAQAENRLRAFLMCPA
ncbi:MAG TPA: tetratricopeptide repeat protein [Rhizomicrobium sp.]|nr:tetratricopeptide repeat protein [Rhizomicrobium sp.]